MCEYAREISTPLSQNRKGGGGAKKDARTHTRDKQGHAHI